MKRYLLLALTIGLGFSSLSPVIANTELPNESNFESIEETIPFDLTKDFNHFSKSKINENKILIKADSFIFNNGNSFIGSDIQSCEFIGEINNEIYYEITLKKGIKSYDIIENLRKNPHVITAELDYKYRSEALEISTFNYDSNNQTYLDEINTKQAWEFMNNNNGVAGGTKDVVVAVIDTGIDLNHEDLKNNIWTNIDEIPNNNEDDDHNGFIDDVHGYNFVDKNNIPEDDNGHGTHVAGVIGAEKNNKGITGIAYNCKIMPIKAGNSSGYFNTSNVIKAIQYASQNGADIINMSFGGSASSVLLQDVLKKAYTNSILVSAAGNSAAQNQYNYDKYYSECLPQYPACLPYVIGVMSCDNNYVESKFTNFDVFPNNNVEYEIYAPGEKIYSTFLDNTYQMLSGTSMSAPLVSGAAALLRSQFKNQDEFATKFIYSQLINCTTKKPKIILPLLKNDSEKHANVCGVLDIEKAISVAPTPSLNIYNIKILDSKNIDPLNNANGIVDAGETVKVGFYLRNKGGVASNVKINIKTEKDPHFQILASSCDYSDVGTYSLQDPGEIKDSNGEIIDFTNSVIFKISESCPDSYNFVYDCTILYKNGLSTDEIVYSFNQSESIYVNSGYILPSIIEKDTILSPGKKYIIERTLTINKGVTLTIEPGVNVQVYAPRNDDLYSTMEATISVRGTLLVNGEPNNMVNIFPCDMFSKYIYRLSSKNCEKVEINNAKIVNMEADCGFVNKTLFKNSHFSYFGNVSADGWYYTFQTINNILLQDILFSAPVLDSCYLDFNKITHNYTYIYSAKNSKFDSNGIITFLYSVNDCSFENSSKGFLKIVLDSNVSNILIYYRPNQTEDISNSIFIVCSQHSVLIKGIKFLGLPEEKIDDVCIDYRDHNLNTHGSITIEDLNLINNESFMPYVEKIEISNIKNENVNIISGGIYTFNIVFSKDMNTNVNPNIYFGSSLPYTDFKIEGRYISKRIYSGEFNFDDSLMNGTMRFSINNARSTFNEPNLSNGAMYSFIVDVSTSSSTDLEIINENDFVKLKWQVSDNSTLMGYNIYRSRDENGNFVKINNKILNKNTCNYVDNTIQPGDSYWYMVVIVLSDFSEHVLTDKKIIITADVLSPTISHDPINRGYLGSSINIKCSANDNKNIRKVSLFYRVKGFNVYNETTMRLIKGYYVANIPSYELKTEGMEYYICADDGINKSYVGTADSPYDIIIQENYLNRAIGDVNGDGVITLKDVQLIIKHINGEIILNDDQFKRADLNGDGNISSSEALKLLKYVNGSISGLE